MDIKNCEIKNVAKENEAIHSPIWTRCTFSGPPPLGFASWQDWAENSHKSGIYADVCVEAICRT